MELTGVDAAAYERVSKDKSGRERSPEEQHEGHLTTCDEHGWTLQLPTYREVGSASKYQRKARAAFDRLIADLESGRFTARVLMLYANNRGSRQTEEWLRLINLCAARNVVFWVDQHERIYDPNKPRDRKSLIDDASKGELDVAEMSQAIRRTTKSSARKGLPHGRIPYGYRRIYDERTKQLVAQELDPVEAPIVREMFERVLAGHTLASIARDLNGRGLKRRGGGDWAARNISLMLPHECYLGLRVHDPGRVSGSAPLTPDAVLSEAVWEPLIDKATFYAVKRILRDPARRSVEHPAAVVHLLSGIAACGVCGEVLRVNRVRQKWRYLCITKGCVTIDKADLEKYAENVVQDYLEKLDKHLVVDEGADDELAAVEARLAEIQLELDELRAAERARRAAGKTRSQFALDTAFELEEEIETLKAREVELRTPSVLTGLIKPGPTVRTEYPGKPFAAKRALAKLVLAPAPTGKLGYGQLQVLPVGPGRRKVPIMAMDRTRFFRPPETPR